MQLYVICHLHLEFRFVEHFVWCASRFYIRAKSIHIVLQQKVLRIVCNVDYQYHSNVLVKELRILKLFDII